MERNMEIDWTKLFALQHELDSRIMKKHCLTGDFFSERLLALQVEVGELANETRCFKYWSVKPPSHRSEILEEYVDGIHFILSLGLVLRFETYVPKRDSCNVKNMVEQFLTIYNCISKLHSDQSIEMYGTLFSEYITLGAMLGFSEQDIEKAYLEKNVVNHERQERGY